MTPAIGQIVRYRLADDEVAINGAREFPAIITQVWSETCVNLRVFYDTTPGRLDEWRASVPHEATPGLSGASGTWGWPKGTP